MLARALARRREMGIRLALGAGRVRIVRQLFVENVILAFVGAAIGLALGQWALQLLLARVPDQLPHFASFDVDLRVIGFASLASIATVMSVRLGAGAPRVARRPAVGGPRRDGRDHRVARGRRTLWFLVAGEFALAALLLVCAGLLMRAFDRVASGRSRVPHRRRAVFSVSLPEVSYPKEEQRLAFWDRLERRMSCAFPASKPPGLITCAPLGCHWGNFFEHRRRGAASRASRCRSRSMRFASATTSRRWGSG